MRFSSQQREPLAPRERTRRLACLDLSFGHGIGDAKKKSASLGGRFPVPHRPAAACSRVMFVRRG